MPRRPRQEIEDAELRSVVERLGDTGPGRPSLHEQFALIARARERVVNATPEIDRWLLFEIDELRRGLTEASERQEQLKQLHARITSPPWFTAVFIRLVAATSHEPPKAIVVYLGTPRVVTLEDSVSPESLKTGEDVLLSHDLNLLLQPLTPGVTRACDVAEFRQTLGDGRVILKSRDTEVVVQAASRLDLSTLHAGDRVRWDPLLGMAFEQLPRSSGVAPFLVDTPIESFADIGGLDATIDRLQRSIRLHMRHRDLVARYALRRVSSVLLVGPPGTGKTMIARALARWLGDESPGGQASFIRVQPSALHSVWYSQTEANYREVFRVAREAGAAHPESPVVLFFDEIDAIGLTRSEGLMRVDDRVLTSFMAELDGFDARGNVLVVAATNRRDALDPALLRPGRLGDLILEVPRPSMAAARAILERHLPASVPYQHDETVTDARRTVIDAAVSRLYAPNGEGEVGAITFRDGTRRPIAARDLVSGAVLANVARMAIERACVRDLDTGVPGIRPDDVIEAVSEAVATAVSALTPFNCHAHITGLPQDLTVARVTPAPGRKRRHHFMTAA
jgi:proteasome ATPase